MTNPENSSQHSEKGEKGERFVESLFHRVFTPLFCYYQPKDLLSKYQHEICDLLICWGKVLIICSIKNWKFDGDYEQYHKDTVAKAISQIQHAEKKLLLLDRDVEIDHPNLGRHRFPRENFTNVIRLVVNLGEGEEFYPLVGETKRNGFVSVLNKDTLEVMLRELDTPTDLLQYLNEREKLLQVMSDIGKRQFVLSGREADLLSLYLKNGREFPRELYDEQFAMITLDVDGSWENFQDRPEVKSKHIANENSYEIDRLIHEVIVPLEVGKPMARLLLSLNRIERRALADDFEKAIVHFPRGTTFRREVNFSSKTIVLLIYDSTLPQGHREELTRFALYGTIIMRDYAMEEILVIGTPETMESFVFAHEENIMPYDPNTVVEIRNGLEALGWFKDQRRREVRFFEYPSTVEPAA